MKKNIIITLLMAVFLLPNLLFADVRMPTKEDLKQKAIIAKILWSDSKTTNKEQQALFEIVKTYPYDDIKAYALNVAVARNCKNLARILNN